MQSFFTSNVEKKDKIINFFKSKKVAYRCTEQYIFFTQIDFINKKGTKTIDEKNYVFYFEWNNIKIKKEHLMAL